MPPKRRAASAARAGGKKAKEGTPKPKDAFTSAKEALLAAGPQVKGKRKVDEHCASQGEVGKMLSNATHPHGVCSPTSVRFTELCAII